jgi:predicted transcriptional regulator
MLATYATDILKYQTTKFFIIWFRTSNTEFLHDIRSLGINDMSPSLNELELKSTEQVKSFIGEILRLLAMHFDGATTINSLRVGHYIGLMSQYKGMPTSNKNISETLGIPRSSVSRIVTDCIEKGWVIERMHVEDGRKRELLIAPDHPEGDNFEKDFRRILNEIFKLYQSGKIVHVDPSKEGF